MFPLALIAESLWTLPASRFFPYGFFVVAAALAGFVAFEMQQAARASATKKDSKAFLSQYGKENGMSVFFDMSEDPSDLAAQPVLARKRR
jgi:hypothetical protein